MGGPSCWPPSCGCAPQPASALERAGAGRHPSGMSTHRIGIDLGGTKIEIIVLGPDGDGDAAPAHPDAGRL